MSRKKAQKEEKKREFMRLLDGGYSVEEACQALNVAVSELGDWLEDEEFCEFMERWRRGMEVIVEGKLIERARKGSVTGAVKFLVSREPERWSEKVMVRQVGEERREVRIVFGWQPSDGRVLGRQGEVIDLEEVNVRALKPLEGEIGRR
jgi:predicted RNA-binding protein YlqC (UPF0109 family)